MLGCGREGRKWEHHLFVRNPSKVLALMAFFRSVTVHVPALMDVAVCGVNYDVVYGIYGCVCVCVCVTFNAPAGYTVCLSSCERRA